MPDTISASKQDIHTELQALVRARLKTPDREQAAIFAGLYYRGINQELFEQRDLQDLYGGLLSHWRFAAGRRPGEALVRVYNPVLEEHGWECHHTVVEILIEDMPFLVDSVRMALERQGMRMLYLLHPTIRMRRNADGEVVAVGDAGGDDGEAVMHIELVRQTDPLRLAALREELLAVLGNVQLAVRDWRPMKQALLDVKAGLRCDRLPLDAESCAEDLDFLDWLANGHFTFLGYREYTLDQGENLRVVSGSGLGILRNEPESGLSKTFADMPAELREKALAPELLLLTKSSASSQVHRAVKMDHISVKRLDEDGRVVGEHRFLGLYGSRAYNAMPQEIPVLRRKLDFVLRKAALASHSHSGKALTHILETYPRDELFQIDAETLLRISLGILQLGESHRPRLFVRQDPFQRYLSCLVYAPRERYDTNVRRRMQQILAQTFGAEEVEFSVTLSESPMARILFTVPTSPETLPDYDVHEIEERLAEAILSWSDHLHAALLEQMGEERGSALYLDYAEGFPAGYREDISPRSAVHDIDRMSRLGEGNELAMSLYRPLEAEAGRLRFKVFRHAKGLPLSQALPMLEHMGVKVEDEHPYRVDRSGAAPVWVHDFGLSYAGQEAPDTASVRDKFQDAFAKVWYGLLEEDGFNALVLRAHLDWRQISLLRALAKYLRQSSGTFSQAYMEEAAVAHPDIVAMLVELFELRFQPQRPKQVQQQIEHQEAAIKEKLEAVQSLDYDRILRGFLALVQACLRTNYYQREADGSPKASIALKLDPSRIPGLPEPRPMFEIFVYSPRVEGVHLRGGQVARGGLRWSDRREDFRTEILGLMKAQMVKNAVIVPVGAKGGFVVKRPPEKGGREALREEVIGCYRLFISGLLDVADNLVDGVSHTAADIVRYDGDDTYLVVAADKGTATFSDIANEVSASYGFWLGDAFASGGRAGYDHKKMGITARGAWEAVRQHFRAADIGNQGAGFSVVGIGDMSGDVFGNGLLWSQRIRLLAAFDHRHIFIDPDPDPQAGFAERKRLFELPSSSWADYDETLISEGGGVYPRHLKSIQLSEQARAMLGVESTSLTPAALISAILRAPVDLLWNGGIGTYVKASSERHNDVGDHINDSLRVNADELRCQVVGEGGNLGLTQLARIEYARAGGHLDTDFIHNAGGVDCSDHEVNIKILLDTVLAAGDMTRKQRDQLLEQMSDEVAGLVLEDCYWQANCIGLEHDQAAELLPEHRQMLRQLEKDGHLNRALEFLPDEVELKERQSAGEGLCRPELSVVISYAKHSLYQQLLDSDLPEDGCMTPELERYFPGPIRERFMDQIHAHRLRREILSTVVANRLVNRFGTTFCFRLQDDLGVSAAAVARACAVVWSVFDLRRLWSAAADLLQEADPAVLSRQLWRARRLARGLCRRLLQQHGENIPTGDLIERYRHPVRSLSEGLCELEDERLCADLKEERESLEAAGLPADLAAWVAGLGELQGGMEVADVARDVHVDPQEAALVYFAQGADLSLDWVQRKLEALPSHDRWHAIARAGLRDQLFSCRGRLCRSVFGGAMADTSAVSKLEAWGHQNHAAVERYRHLIYDLRSLEKVDMAMISVLLRELNGLAESSASAGGKLG